MNKDNAKAFLPLVHALADGKTIQMHAEGEDWIDLKDIAFAGSPDNYRVKSTGPREWWIVLSKTDGLPWVAKSLRKAQEYVGEYPDRGAIIHVREVGL